MLEVSGSSGSSEPSSGAHRILRPAGSGMDSTSESLTEVRVRRFGFSSTSSGGGVSAAFGGGVEAGPAAKGDPSRGSCTTLSDEIARLESDVD